jgi:hypothetical protein
VRQREGRLEKSGSRDGGIAEQGRLQREAKRRRNSVRLRLVHGRVEHHHTGQQVGVVDRPAEGDDAAPVVAEGEDGPVQFQRVGEHAEVSHALLEWTANSGAFGESHVQLVNSDNAPCLAAVSGSIRRPGNE